MKWVRPVRPCWRNSENAEDLTENCCVWESYWRVWKGWKCLLECSTTVDPTERKIFCSTRSLSSNYPGSWRGQAWKSGLQEGFSQPSLQTSLPWLSVNNHAVYSPSLYCVCIVYMQINTYGMCVEHVICVICHICGILKFLHTYIYTALLLFFFPHTQWWKCFWKVKNFVCPFHWIQIQMLDSEKQVFIKRKRRPIFLNSVTENKTWRWCSHLMDQTLVGINWCNLACIAEAALITCACESESRVLGFLACDSPFIISRRYCAKDQPCVHSGAWHCRSRECLSCSHSPVLQIVFPFLLSGSYL